jgi:hypothetical protein
MKKFPGAALVFCAFFSTFSAKIPANAIGLRLGGGSYGEGAEVSYQKALRCAERLELDLGWNGAINGTGVYQWNWDIADAVNWYAGFGAHVALWDKGVLFGIGGQIGIEYDFNDKGVPLLLCIDTRPMFGTRKSDGLDTDCALSIRYTF